MEVKVCKSCKHMFQYIAGPILCPKCRQIEEQAFEAVRDYLRENVGASLADVSEATGIATKTILRFLREGRLEVTKDSPIALVCETCGKRILTGLRCSECEAKMLNSLQQMKGYLVEKNEDEARAKMRFLDAKQYRR